MGHGGDGSTDAGGAICDTGGLTLDRSKVHILLCDKDPGTAHNVLNLLQKCSYQVTAVKSAGQVMEVLNSCSFEVDLILTEVELPKEKGYKMLKHIVRQERLRRIPIVMMSAQDEMAIVVKCLRLGAVDYLLKPLRTNELLNLWTHMWRRRRMLGLTEKQLINGSLKVPFDLLVSETSESNNTNSTTLFSDDTDDRKRIISTHGANTVASRDFESEMSPQLELSLKLNSDLAAEVARERLTKAGLVPSPPKKSELKVGQSSAFLTYAKIRNQSSERLANVPSNPEVSNQTIEPIANVQSTCKERANSSMKVRGVQEHLVFPQPHSVLGIPSAEASHGGPPYHWESTKTWCQSENGSGEPESRDSSSTAWNHSPLPCELMGGGYSSGDPLMHLCGPNEGLVNVEAMPFMPPPQFLHGGMMNPANQPPASLMPPSIHLYHGLPQDDRVSFAAGIPPMHTLQPSHVLPLNTAFSYYPLGLHVAAPQLGPFPGWPAMVAAPMVERKLGQAERREAALSKFRRKRKDRCFEKKIRYVSRKKLAEQRPRIRGQFVRRTNDTDMNENGVLDEYDDEEEDEEHGFGDLVGMGSSLESIAEDA